MPSLRLKAALIGHVDDVDMAIFSPDDRLVATCALDRTIRLFTVDGHCLKVLRGHTGNILSIAWTSDGKRLVSSGVDGTVREWDVESGEQLRCNDIDGVRTDTLAIDSDGRIFAGDDHGRIATIIDGVVSYTPAHKAGIKKLVFEETSGILVTLSYDRAIAIWKVDGERKIQEIRRAEFPALVWARSAVLIDHRKVALGTFGSTYGIFDWESNTWDMAGVVPDNSLNAVTVVDEEMYAIGDAGVLLCNGKPTVNIGSLCNFLLPISDLLLTGGQLGQLLDARSGRMLYQHHSPLNCATSFCRNERVLVVVGTYTGEALVFSVDAGDKIELVKSIKIFDNAIKGLVATNERIFSVCASTDIAWHDTSEFKLIRFIRKAHEKIANACSLAGPDGFASVGRDLKLRIWVGDSEEVYQTPHPNSVKCICASDDRNTLMTGAYTGTLAGFDMASRSWGPVIRPTTSGISSVTFDRVEHRFLASSYDGHIYPAAI